MKKTVAAAAFALFALAVPAQADDTVDSLKSQALETCKKEMSGGEANAEVDKVCGCVVDNIVTAFGEDAPRMLKILGANLNPSDVAEIAKLLGMSEAEAKTFVEAADEKMDTVMDTCMPS
ncbi:MAG: hypothetical protein QM698_16775 [Micropepsaceae bacterium]